MSELAKWDDRYRTGDIPWDTGHPSSELVRVVAEQKIAPCRALELGCGTGTNAIWLAQQGFDVTAVDLSSLAVERARRAAHDAGVAIHFVQGDVLDPPDLGKPFPFFFDRGCYHVVRRIDAQRFLQTLEKLTGPGTLGLTLTGNSKERHEPGPPVVSEEEMRAELGQLFDILWLREFRFDHVEAVGVQFLGWSCGLHRR
jgi:2-polyprenyl-3-methyl-5-hydroxy-6-metoxy-1,4-benzoquinol methylase